MLWLLPALAAPAPLTFPNAPAVSDWPTCPLTDVEILITGDIMSHGQQLQGALFQDGSWHYERVFQEVAPFISSADLAMANLETPIAGEDLGFSGFPRFNAPEEYAIAVKAAGFDLVQTTNNHSLDRGALGVTRTLDTLDRLGFQHAGTYRDEASRQPGAAFVDLPGGLRLAFLAYTYGTEAPLGEDRWWAVNLIDVDVIADDIAAVRADADLVIVGLHWGIEYQHAPLSGQVRQAHAIIDAGADVVMGTHPHVLQPAEVRTVVDENGARDGIIFYSFGNFVSNQRDANRDGGLMARLSVLRCDRTDSTWIRGVRLLPVWVDQRNDADELDFRVLPVPRPGEACGGPDTSPEDCANMERFRKHVGTLFPAEQFDWEVGPPADVDVVNAAALPNPTDPTEPGWAFRFLP